METKKKFNKTSLNKFNRLYDKNIELGKYNIPKLNTYLNKSEVNNLKNLEKLSNKSKKITEFNSDIMNLSINEFIDRWANNNIDIFTDLVKFMSGLRNYKGYFNDIDQTGNWTTGIYVIIKDFVNIFTKEKRSIYFGITLILISLLLYFIQITS